MNGMRRGAQRARMLIYSNFICSSSRDRSAIDSLLSRVFSPSLRMKSHTLALAPASPLGEAVLIYLALKYPPKAKWQPEQGQTRTRPRWPRVNRLLDCTWALLARESITLARAASQ